MAELRKLKVTEMNRLTVEEFKEAKKDSVGGSAG